jgi:hypothetical protein
MMRSSFLAIGSALLALAAASAGCDSASDTEPVPGDELLAPPAVGQGHQYSMTTVIDPGVEAEYCKFVRAPAEGMYIHSDQVRFTAGSHHFLLYQTPYEAIPEAKEDGTPVDTSGVFDCSDGPSADWLITKLIGGSQNGTGDAVLGFPPGVAMKVPPNAVLLMNAHYINASDQAIEPKVRINLYTAPEDEVTTEGDILFLYNPLIHVPANGSARARWRCPVNSDITLVNVQSHMHQRGVGFAGMIAGKDPFYTNDRWEDVPAKIFEGGLNVSAGSHLDYYCDYQNHEARDVYQGPRSTDEMCMLIGSFYPADQTTANCLTPEGELAGEWVGNGSATCAETLACLQASAAAAGAEQRLPAITDCMLASAPEVASEASALLRCVVASTNPLSDCAAQLTACQDK